MATTNKDGKTYIEEKDKPVAQGNTMAYTAICGLCKGNGYITVEVKAEGELPTDEIKQCWLCESKGERTLQNQAEVDTFIYETYYKK
tara:strand:- start:1189 stop:1449 length:261 start_codon:yes stop_codon:yes gene_type:complete